MLDHFGGHRQMDRHGRGYAYGHHEEHEEHEEERKEFHVARHESREGYFDHQRHGNHLGLHGNHHQRLPHNSAHHKLASFDEEEEEEEEIIESHQHRMMANRYDFPPPPLSFMRPAPPPPPPPMHNKLSEGWHGGHGRESHREMQHHHDMNMGHHGRNGYANPHHGGHANPHHGGHAVVAGGLSWRVGGHGGHMKEGWGRKGIE